MAPGFNEKVDRRYDARKACSVKFWILLCAKPASLRVKKGCGSVAPETAVALCSESAQ